MQIKFDTITQRERISADSLLSFGLLLPCGLISVLSNSSLFTSSPNLSKCKRRFRTATLISLLDFIVIVTKR